MKITNPYKRKPQGVTHSRLQTISNRFYRTPRTPEKNFLGGFVVPTNFLFYLCHMTTLQNPTEVKSIKAHTCDFCNEPIRIGHVYLKSVHKGDTVYSWKTHTYCGELADKMKMYTDAADCGYEGVDTEFFMESVSCKHDDILSAMLTESINVDVYQQLRHVSWHHKLWYVIRHYNNLSKPKE